MPDETTEQRLRREAGSLLCKLVGWTLIAALSGAYLGRLFPNYDWRLGLLALTSLALGVTNAVVTGQRLHKARTSQRCHRCGGLLSCSDRILVEAIWFPDGTAPPIIDRTRTCEACGLEHHQVFADKRQTGALANNHGLAASQIFVGGDINLWPEYQRQWANNKPTRAGWERLLRELQQAAAKENREHGMIWRD